MFVACGLSNYLAGLAHLANHAFFKAALFLTAGTLIHAMLDEQDLRGFPTSGEVLPFTGAIMSLSSASLAGMPYFSGYYSKDLILETSYTNYTFSSCFVFSFAAQTLICSNAYSDLASGGSNGLNYTAFTKGLMEAPVISMGIPLTFLVLGAVVSGMLFADVVLYDGGSFFMGNALYIIYSGNKAFDVEFLPFLTKTLPNLVGFLALFATQSAATSQIGGQFSYKICELFYTTKIFLFRCLGLTKGVTEVINSAKYNVKANSGLVYRFNFWFYHSLLLKKFFFDALANKFIGLQVFLSAYFVVFRVADKGFLELFGPDGVIGITLRASHAFSALQTGHMFNYMCSMLTFTLGLGFLLELGFF